MKMYVLVRNNLSNSEKAVQAGHALARYLMLYPETEWTNGTLVYLKVKDEKELETWINRLKEDDMLYATYKDPMYDKTLTAVATVSTKTELFSSLKLL